MEYLSCVSTIKFQKYSCLNFLLTVRKCQIRRVQEKQKKNHKGKMKCSKLSSSCCTKGYENVVILEDEWDIIITFADRKINFPI